MAIARFVMVACSSTRSSIRRSLTSFEALKLNLLSASVPVANVFMERGRDSTLQAGFTTCPIKTKKRRQERVKV